MLTALARAMIPHRLWTRLALARQRRVVSRFRPFVARHQFGGLPLTVHIEDPTGALWYDHDWETPAEITLLAERGRLREGARVFDIGAHQAIVAMMLADLAGESGQVVAVEAVEHNVGIARRNLEANDARRVTLLHAAASDAPGTLRFTERLNGHVAGEEEPGRVLRAVTVDELSESFGPPDVLFVDVEGYELHVLRGARQTLATSRPDMYVEVHAGGHGLERFGTVEDLLGLVPAGYEVFVSPASEPVFRPIAEGYGTLSGHALLVALAPR